MKDDALIQLTRLISINHHYSITNSTTINQAVLTTPHSYLPSFTTISPLLPSGKLTVCELENGPIEIVDLIYPLKHGGSVHRFLYVYQRIIPIFT
jgi:hypothetical protein